MYLGRELTEIRNSFSFSVDVWISGEELLSKSIEVGENSPFMEVKNDDEKHI